MRIRDVGEAALLIIYVALAVALVMLAVAIAFDERDKVTPPPPGTAFSILVAEWGDPLGGPAAEAIDAAAEFWRARVGATVLPPSEVCEAPARTIVIELVPGPHHAAASVTCWDALPRRATVYHAEAFGDSAGDTAHVRAVMKHELGHALGITRHGGEWDRSERAPGVVAAYHRAGGRCSTVPVQRERAHWHPVAMRGELMAAGMAPWVVPDPPASEITLASLADLGWTVDLSLAEPYAVADPDYCTEPLG